jgi:hypothetical protein
MNKVKKYYVKVNQTSKEKYLRHRKIGTTCSSRVCTLKNKTLGYIIVITTG